MKNISETVTEKTGLNHTPLKKLSPKEKKELRDTLKDLKQPLNEISDELLLRVYLLCGEEPNSQIVAANIISNALILKDIIKNANKLSKKQVIADGRDLFTAIALNIKHLEKKKTNYAVVKSVIRCIQKWVEKVLIKGYLTEETKQSIITLINELALFISQPKSLDDKIIKKYRALLYPLLDTLFSIASQSNAYRTFKLSFQVSKGIIKRFPSLLIEDILPDESISNNIKRFKQSFLTEMEDAVLKGNVDQVSELSDMVDETFGMKGSFIERVQKIWDSQGAALDSETQSVIRSMLFNEPLIQKTFELTKEEDKLSISQLASALISSWEARNDGHLALNSFNILSIVADKFFNLRIGGEVGKISNFNKFAHEVLGNITLPANVNVQIVRPWVEYESSGEKTILIKALVKPC